MVTNMIDKRIVVCSNCGVISDVHYIDDVKIVKKVITEFRCGACGKKVNKLVKKFEFR